MPEDQEDRYCIFEWLPNVHMMQNVATNEHSTNEISIFYKDPAVDVELNIMQKKKHHQLQERDHSCKRIWNAKLQTGNPYFIKNILLMQNVTDNEQHFQRIILPRVLVTQVLRLAYDGLDHNDTKRTYMLIRRLYYWKGLKTSVNKYINQCYICQNRNLHVIEYAHLHFMTPRLPKQVCLHGSNGSF